MLYNAFMNNWAETYKTFSDGQLENLAAGDGFTEEALQALHQELAHRGLTPAKLLKNKKHGARLTLRDQARERSLRGTGLLFYGRRYQSETDRAANIQVRTKWITFAYIPLIPLATYRFKCSEQQSRFFGKDYEEKVLERVPLNSRQVGTTYLRAFVVIASLISAFGLYIVYDAHSRR